MKLNDPISAYNAKHNLDAVLAQHFLESAGVEAYVTEDNSPAGYWSFGRLAEIHKPQVWVSRADAQRAGELLAEYERLAAQRDAERKGDEPKAIEVLCEDCEQTSHFAGSLEGTVQDCPHCGEFVDVGEFEWPNDGVSNG